jgi:hypothetical protein
LEQSRFTAAAITGHQQRSRRRVVQIKQNRQAILGQPKQKGSAREAGRLGRGSAGRRNVGGNRLRRLFVAEFGLDFLVGIEGKEKLVSCGHGDL